MGYDGYGGLWLLLEVVAFGCNLWTLSLEPIDLEYNGVIGKFNGIFSLILQTKRYVHPKNLHLY